MNRAILNLYTDGAFLDKIGCGAWAYHIPDLSLTDCGAMDGPSNVYFELLAAVRGLQRVKLAGRDSRTVNVLIDCCFSRKWIKEVRLRLEGKTNRQALPAESNMLLVSELIPLIRTMPIVVNRVAKPNACHRICHEEASKALFAYVRHNPRAIAALREYWNCSDRLKKLEKEREKQAYRLEQIDGALRRYREILEVKEEFI